MCFSDLDKFENRTEPGVYAYTVDGSSARKNPDKIFAYSGVMIKPKDDSANPNDIRVDFLLTDCPIPPNGEIVVDGVVIPVYRKFYTGVTADLAQVALQFKDLPPNTRFYNGSGYEAGTPVSNLAYNVGQSRFFEVAT